MSVQANGVPNGASYNASLHNYHPSPNRNNNNKLTPNRHANNYFNQLSTITSNVQNSPQRDPISIYEPHNNNNSKMNRTPTRPKNPNPNFQTTPNQNRNKNIRLTPNHHRTPLQNRNNLDLNGANLNPNQKNQSSPQPNENVTFVGRVLNATKNTLFNTTRSFVGKFVSPSRDNINDPNNNQESTRYQSMPNTPQQQGPSINSNYPQRNITNNGYPFSTNQRRGAQSQPLTPQMIHSHSNNNRRSLLHRNFTEISHNSNSNNNIHNTNIPNYNYNKNRNNQIHNSNASDKENNGPVRALMMPLTKTDTIIINDDNNISDNDNTNDNDAVSPQLHTGNPNIIGTPRIREAVQLIKSMKFSGPEAQELIGAVVQQSNSNGQPMQLNFDESGSINLSPRSNHSVESSHSQIPIHNARRFGNNIHNGRRTSMSNNTSPIRIRSGSVGSIHQHRPSTAQNRHGIKNRNRNKNKYHNPFYPGSVSSSIPGFNNLHNNHNINLIGNTRRQQQQQQRYRNQLKNQKQIQKQGPIRSTITTQTGSNINLNNNIPIIKSNKLTPNKLYQLNKHNSNKKKTRKDRKRSRNQANIDDDNDNDDKDRNISKNTFGFDFNDNDNNDIIDPDLTEPALKRQRIHYNYGRNHNQLYPQIVWTDQRGAIFSQPISDPGTTAALVGSFMHSQMYDGGNRKHFYSYNNDPRIRKNKKNRLQKYHTKATTVTHETTSEEEEEDDNDINVTNKNQQKSQKQSKKHKKSKNQQNGFSKQNVMARDEPSDSDESDNDISESRDQSTSKSLEIDHGNGASRIAISIDKPSTNNISQDTNAFSFGENNSKTNELNCNKKPSVQLRTEDSRPSFEFGVAPTNAQNGHGFPSSIVNNNDNNLTNFGAFMPGASNGPSNKIVGDSPSTTVPLTESPDNHSSNNDNDNNNHLINGKRKIITPKRQHGSARKRKFNNIDDNEDNNRDGNHGFNVNNGTPKKRARITPQKDKLKSKPKVTIPNTPITELFGSIDNRNNNDNYTNNNNDNIQEEIKEKNENKEKENKENEKETQEEKEPPKPEVKVPYYVRVFQEKQARIAAVYKRRICDIWAIECPEKVNTWNEKKEKWKRSFHKIYVRVCAKYKYQVQFEYDGESMSGDADDLPYEKPRKEPEESEQPGSKNSTPTKVHVGIVPGPGSDEKHPSKTDQFSSSIDPIPITFGTSTQQRDPQQRNPQTQVQDKPSDPSPFQTDSSLFNNNKIIGNGFSNGQIDKNNNNEKKNDTNNNNDIENNNSDNNSTGFIGFGSFGNQNEKSSENKNGNTQTNDTQAVYIPPNPFATSNSNVNKTNDSIDKNENKNEVPGFNVGSNIFNAGNGFSQFTNDNTKSTSDTTFDFAKPNDIKKSNPSNIPKDSTNNITDTKTSSFGGATDDKFQFGFQTNNVFGINSTNDNQAPKNNDNNDSSKDKPKDNNNNISGFGTGITPFGDFGSTNNNDQNKNKGETDTPQIGFAFPGGFSDKTNTNNNNNNITIPPSKVNNQPAFQSDSGGGLFGVKDTNDNQNQNDNNNNANNIGGFTAFGGLGGNTFNNQQDSKKSAFGSGTDSTAPFGGPFNTNNNGNSASNGGGSMFTSFGETNNNNNPSPFGSSGFGSNNQNNAQPGSNNNNNNPFGGSFGTPGSGSGSGFSKTNNDFSFANQTPNTGTPSKHPFGTTNKKRRVVRGKRRRQR